MTLEEALRTLGYDKIPTFEELRERFKDLVFKTHPDHNNGADSGLFTSIKKAYDTLKKAIENTSTSLVKTGAKVIDTGIKVASPIVIAIYKSSKEKIKVNNEKRKAEKEALKGLDTKKEDNSKKEDKENLRVNKNGVTEHIPDSLIIIAQLALAALEAGNGIEFLKVPFFLRNNKEFIKQAIFIHESIFEYYKGKLNYLFPELGEDKKTIKLLIKLYGLSVLNYINSSLTEDEDSMIELCCYYGMEALEYADLNPEQYLRVYERALELAKMYEDLQNQEEQKSNIISFENYQEEPRRLKVA